MVREILVVRLLLYPVCNDFGLLEELLDLGLHLVMGDDIEPGIREPLVVFVKRKVGLLHYVVFQAEALDLVFGEN